MFMKKYLSYLESFSLINDRLERTRKLWSKNEKIMTEEKTIDFIKKNCKDFLETPVCITRTIYNDEIDFFYSEPIQRHSLENLNFYNLIIDNSIMWNGYPKRLKSFCCTLYGRSQLGDITYFVIPVDNSKWGLCTGSDLFVSFTKFIKETGFYINDFFNDFYDFVKDEIGMELNDVNYQTFKEQILKVETMLDENSDLRYDFIENFGLYDDNEIGLFNTIENLMNPKINDFEICTLKDMYNNDYPKQNVLNRINRECWTESPCIFIRRCPNNKEFFAKLNLDFVEYGWRNDNYIDKK